MLLKKIAATLFVTCAVVSLSLDAAPKPDWPIFVNALPQSGDFYISHNLTRFFDLQTFRVSNKSFPQDTILLEPFQRFSTGKDLYLNVGHVPPSVTNLTRLHNTLPKLLLHVRDPREALVSWLDYTERHFNHSFTLGLIPPVPPAEYFSWSTEDKIDWQIDHFFTYSVDWLVEWADAVEVNRGLNILVTTFEEMVADPVAYFKKVAAFYGADPNELTAENVYPFYRAQYHFGPEDLATWRERLTPAQQERVTAAIPDHIFTVFGWEK